MVEQSEVFEELEQRIRIINMHNGWDLVIPDDWNDDWKIPGKIALIHSEVSEALEAFRKRDFENFKEELADVIIRVLDLTSGLDFCDISYEIDKKLEKNKKRGYKHGDKKC